MGMIIGLIILSILLETWSLCRAAALADEALGLK